MFIEMVYVDLKLKVKLNDVYLAWLNKDLVALRIFVLGFYD